MISSMQLWAVLVAAILGFFVGAPWYSKCMFGRIWLKETGITEEECKARGHKKLIFVYSLILSLISAFALAYILGPAPSLLSAIGLSLIISIAWIATASGINDLFAGRSWRLFLVDSGYHVARFLIYGIILGLWH